MYRDFSLESSQRSAESYEQFLNNKVPLKSDLDAATIQEGSQLGSSGPSLELLKDIQDYRSYNLSNSIQAEDFYSNYNENKEQARNQIKAPN